MPQSRPGKLHGRCGNAQRRHVTRGRGDMPARRRGRMGKACSRNGVGVCLPGGPEKPAGDGDARHGEQAPGDRPREDAAQARDDRPYGDAVRASAP
ncbi:hypothetical protein [Actinoallomurus sp. CA-150999]|uniref:hypothetical protein n=1 Tax=Actinoallomurus sp. CA-150999 TaxID=3239887 RepID=UPI003D8C9568